MQHGCSIRGIGRVALAGLLGGAIGLLPGTAGAEPPPRGTVLAMLSTIERGPEADAWRRLGPETVGVLVDVYQDPSVPRILRRRAVEAAAHFPGPATKTFLLAVAQAPGQHDLVLRTALLALGRAFGAGVVPELAEFLGHRDRDVREGAIMALAQVNTPPARAALIAHRDREARGYLVERIDQALARPPRPDPPSGAPPPRDTTGGPGDRDGVAPRRP